MRLTCACTYMSMHRILEIFQNTPEPLVQTAREFHDLNMGFAV